jgi:hypothetical protein
MTLSVSGVQALTVKGIDSAGGVRDAVFKNNACLARLRDKQGMWDGLKLTIPFNYFDSTQTNGKYYIGAESLSKDIYDPITELSFELIELEETLVITKRDLALNSGKNGRIKLVEKRLEICEKAMRERFTKGIFSDGTAATGALTTSQFVGMQAFLKASSVNYGGVTDTDVSQHVAYVLDNSGTARALTTSLHQSVLGGCSEGEEKPSVGIMRQNVMDKFIELIKPHQRTVKENSLDGLGHAKNTLVYSGVDHIVDNLAPATSIVFLNEKHVKLYAHGEYDMKRESFDKLEDSDAIMERIFFKGAFACGVLRYQGWLKDISVA